MSDDAKDMRSTDSDANGYVIAKLRAHDEKFLLLESKVDANTGLTQEVVDILRMGKGFFRLIGWMGRTARVVLTGAAALYGLYQIFIQWLNNRPPTP